jgi:hypothetical protein
VSSLTAGSKMLTAEVALTTKVDKHVAARTPLCSRRRLCARVCIKPIRVNAGDARPSHTDKEARRSRLPCPLFSPAVGEDAGVPERDHLLVVTVRLLEGVEANVGWTFKLGD